VRGVCAVVLARASGARAEAPLTLDQALALAHQANVRLPLSVLDVASADVALRVARAQRWVRASVEGSLVYAPPGVAAPTPTTPTSTCSSSSHGNRCMRAMP
jgi:hypothetical protein